MTITELAKAKQAIKENGHFVGYFYDQSNNAVNRLNFVQIHEDGRVLSDNLTEYSEKDIFLTRASATQMAIVILSERINILAGRLFIEGE